MVAPISVVRLQLAERQDCRWGSVLDDDELFYVLISDGKIDSGLHPLMGLARNSGV